MIGMIRVLEDGLAVAMVLFYLAREMLRTRDWDAWRDTKKYRFASEIAEEREKQRREHNGYV